MGRLFVIATPIGHLGDLTARAVEVLSACDLVACEDTRHSRKILSHLGLSIPMVSCRGQNSGQCVPKVLERMASGADVAYLTDAGTPGISDPGGMLVRAAREAGHIVSPIPGPSAVTALISVSGVPSRGWLFEGFLPPKGERRVKRLAVLTERGEAFVLYESPHRIGKLFDELARVCPTWEAIIGRELTKIHEQIVAGNVASIVEMIGVGTIPARGEFVILVWPGKSR